MNIKEIQFTKYQIKYEINLFKANMHILFFEILPSAEMERKITRSQKQHLRNTSKTTETTKNNNNSQKNNKNNKYK